MASYSDPNGTHNPATGTSPPAAWGDLVRDNIVWLAGDAASGNPKPMCRVYNSAGLNIATATWTDLTMNSERYDVGGCHSTSVNTARLTVPAGGGGVYHIGGSVSFASNATGVRAIGIWLNGTTLLASNGVTVVSATNQDLTIGTDYKLAAADYVTLRVYQSSGGILAVSSSANNSPEFYWSWAGLG